MEDSPSLRSRFENRLIFWFTAVGVPLAISLAVLPGAGIDFSLAVLLSVIFSLILGWVVYTILLHLENRDKAAQIEKLEKAVANKRNKKKGRKN